MDGLASLPLLLGGSWASGVNMYLTAAGLGVAQRMGWLSLPGGLDHLGNPLIIGLAVILYGAQFVADKIPFIDSLWDSVHTFIRPAGGALMGYLATGDANPVMQTAVALATGSIALSSHLTKATTRVAINSAPTGVGNSVASVSEDAAVVGVLYLVIKHPVIAALVVIAVIACSIWFLIKMARFLKKIFAFGKKEELQTVSATTS